MELRGCYTLGSFTMAPVIAVYSWDLAQTVSG
jgi:hypothetical protein